MNVGAIGPVLSRTAPAAQHIGVLQMVVSGQISASKHFLAVRMTKPGVVVPFDIRDLRLTEADRSAESRPARVCRLHLRVRRPARAERRKQSAGARTPQR